MSRDSRLYQKNPQTKRFNIVNLPRSGAFGNRKTIEKGLISGIEKCVCEGIGCWKIANPVYPTVCDFIVSANEIKPENDFTNNRINNAIIGQTFIVGVDKI
jgi:hypothetical protein